MRSELRSIPSLYRATLEYQSDFKLADDVALLAQRCSNMQRMPDDLVNRSSAAGLFINVSKIKSYDVNTVSPASITVAGQAVENVESFQYLGSQMAADGCPKIDIDAWI